AVTYSNAAKTALLGVSTDTLAAHGAVSAETAREMAVGVRTRFSADVGISITGIAGPASDNTKKPVGLVYIALAHADGVDVREFHFSGSRERIRRESASNALDMLRRLP
ncbi:MAG: nicotinamide-nucleotide amidohydrolase family protein, partial [Clostridiales bacterium]|nr:nicotinamide-nucleotide amidohydrolase family protein [Clostridiales bacterium]